MVRYIAGDIGGTNSRLHLIEIRERDGVVTEEVKIAEETYSSQKYSSMAVVVQLFLDKYIPDKKDWPKAMCLAVAGPVRNNKSQITNVSWLIDGEELQTLLNIPTVSIINDFVGVGYGLLALERSDVIALNDVETTPGAPKACVGAGTGLGETYLTCGAGGEYEVWGSEGGHTDFAPRNEIEFKLLQFMKEKERVPRVSVERVVSGMGIPRIYEFFCSMYPHEIQDSIQQRIRTEDPGLVIAENAKSGKCGLCRRAMDLFVQCYGAEAGNLALKTLPGGGLYIAGGIAPKILWAIQHDNQFWTNYIAKGRMQGLLEKIPVFIVINPHVGLLGAKVVCRRLLRKQGLATIAESDQLVVPKPKPPKLEEEYNCTDISDNQLASPLIRAPTRRDVSYLNPPPPPSLHAPTIDLTLIERQLTRAALLGGCVASVATLATVMLFARVRK